MVANSSGSVCPQIFPSPSSSTGEYLIHTNHDYAESPLRITSSNLTQFIGDFEDGRFKLVILLVLLIIIGYIWLVLKKEN